MQRKNPLELLKETLKPLGYHYQSKIGEGTYGLVAEFTKRIDDKDEKFAVKLIKDDFFENLRLAKRCVREMYLLRMFNHPNINSLVDVIQFFDKKICYICCVLKHKDTDLKNVFESTQPLTDNHCAYFTYQILLALKYLHAANVGHRDLKMANILVDADCSAQVGDFGLGRQFESSFEEKAAAEVDPILDGNESKESPRPRANTQYVVTRWYRAPEVILGKICPSYGSPDYQKSSIDMWSLGCMLLEMLSRLGNIDTGFIQGKSSADQLKKIFVFLECPENLECIQNQKAHDYIKKYAVYFGFDNKKQNVKPYTLKEWEAELIKKVEEINDKRIEQGQAALINMVDLKDGIDLLKKLLQIDPRERLTAENALNHDFVRGFPEDKNSTFDSQLREKTGELSISGAFAIWLKQLEKQEIVTKEILDKYINHIILSFREPDKIKAKIHRPISVTTQSVFKPADQSISSSDTDKKPEKTSENTWSTVRYWSAPPENYPSGYDPFATTPTALVK